MKFLTMIFLVFLLPASPIVLLIVANKSKNKKVIVRWAVVCGFIFVLLVFLGVLSVQRQDSASFGFFFFLIYSMPCLLVRLISYPLFRGIDMKPRILLFIIDGLLLVPTIITVKGQMPR